MLADVEGRVVVTSVLPSFLRPSAREQDRGWGLRRGMGQAVCRRGSLHCGPAFIVGYFVSRTPSGCSEPVDRPLKQMDYTWPCANYESSIISCPCGLESPGRGSARVPSLPAVAGAGLRSYS